MIFAELICKLVVIQHEFLKTCNWEYFDANKKKTEKNPDLNAVLSESVHNIECYGIFFLNFLSQCFKFVFSRTP